MTFTRKYEIEQPNTMPGDDGVELLNLKYYNKNNNNICKSMVC